MHPVRLLTFVRESGTYGPVTDDRPRPRLRETLKEAVVATTTRRRLLGALAALPLIGAAAPRLSRLVPVAWSRPAGDGTSASRCAACGSPGHSMLAADCPAASRGIV